ncbi:uncharacterized protein LOC126687253 [Mercurialis annua]|uniref:uncharacterized protein LOC126687253 n=1 Tax=Mercurialis annua TaxID=3986 RepID=UPI00215F3375|nr:uncharacterized protein LOC126687253 [Mercurialis annua]XP_050237702.1 uncharacterized protein LOC126687253 [Mercurialis annua]XP_050237703.1 uncharacterized protein LOC126687253 [Mercurialis annua]
MQSEVITLKGLVDKENNRVLFVESDKDFIDMLFSFLTMPMGAIIMLTNNDQPAIRVGCMNNLYASIEKLDVWRLRTEACRSMLLHPRNGAEDQCRELKLQLIDRETVKFFYCDNASKCKLVSQYEGTICDCGIRMDSFGYVWKGQLKEKVSDSQDGVFVKQLARVTISDELQVMPPSAASSCSLLSKIGVIDANAIEERTFDIGVDQAVNLLKSSLVSKTPLTETLLKPKEIPELSKEASNQQTFSLKTKSGEYTSKGKDKILVKLMLSKSNKKVCFAEVGEDFVDLLFSFLTVPLGYILKEMNGAASNGCIHHLYNSIECLDVEKYFKSNDHKEILLSPKIAPNLGYANQLLRVEEAVTSVYNLRDEAINLSVKDPKLSHKITKTSGGFVMMGPALFTVTDNLIVTPISPISGVSILSKLNVPFNEVEERSVYVGTEEAVHLMVASFMSESALTDTFISQVPYVPKQEP